MMLMMKENVFMASVKRPVESIKVIFIESYDLCMLKQPTSLPQHRCRFPRVYINK